MNHKLQQVQRFYDDLIYGDKANLQKSEEMLKAFPSSTLKQLSQLEVLEVGLGRGEWSLGLATYAKKYTGLDCSSKTVDYVRQELIGAIKNAAAITITLGNVLSLPFPDNSFDAIFCIGVLHHATPNPRGGFCELFRVLKPGGTMNLMLYGKVQPRNALRGVVFQFSRLGTGLQSLILRLAMWLERFNLPDV